MKTLVIIPTYNESETLPGLVATLLELGIPDLFVLVVDDNSPDRTGDLADRLAQQHPNRISVIHRPGKQGLGRAYIEGFAWGRERGFEVLCQMDADFSHDPHDLPRLLLEVETDADLAIGSRRVRGGRIIGWGVHRHLMSWGASVVSRLLLGLGTRDVTAGFRAYRAGATDRLLAADVQSNGYAFQEETIFITEKSGCVVREVPVVFRDRELGESKLSPKEAAAFFATLWRLRRRRSNRN
jgi:dolichol-phosphate mannosyltransferase